MSGFFLNQKSSLLFYYGRIRISFSRLRGGTKQGKYCSCLVARPSLTLQGHCLPSHSCLCLLYLFGADYIMGSCLIILIGQNGSYWGYYLYSLLSSSFDSPKTQSLRLSHQDGLVGGRRSCLCSWPASLGAAWLPRSSLLLMSKCSSLGWSEVDTWT